MNLPYNASIPAAADPPKNDQPIMLINAQSINSWVQIDHFGFGNAFGGYHNLIHLVDQLTPFMAVGELYNETQGSDTQLFYESALGVITQLTGPNAPSQNFK